MLTVFCFLVGRKVSFFQPDDEVVGKSWFPSPLLCGQLSVFCLMVMLTVTSLQIETLSLTGGVVCSVLAFQKLRYFLAFEICSQINTDY